MKQRVGSDGLEAFLVPHVAKRRVVAARGGGAARDLSAFFEVVLIKCRAAHHVKDEDAFGSEGLVHALEVGEHLCALFEDEKRVVLRSDDLGGRRRRQHVFQLKRNA